MEELPHTKSILLRKRTMLGILGVALVILGALIVWSVQHWTGWFLLGLAAPSFYHAWRYHKYREHELYRLIVVSASQVVWVYHEVVRSMPFGIKTFDRTIVHFKKEDGTEQTLFTMSNEVKAFLKEIEPYCTSATFGYSVDKEQLYRANPHMLKRYDD